MTTFEDGPAKGKALLLQRSPVFLRIVVDEKTGRVDVLDQPDDVPRLSETLHGYVLTGPPTWMHINARGEGGGMFKGGSYRLIQPQPPWEKMAGKTTWARWCECEAVVPEFARGAVERGSWG